MLTPEQKSKLLSVARESLAHAVAGAPAPDLRTDDPALLELRGAFVTLKIDGELRGCIGHVIGVTPLIESVAQNARAAALDDPRFPSVRPAELDRISIEVSALTPMREVADASEVEVGRHGLMITKGHRRGLLLPQVATEYGWDREEFLAHTCRKAGLPPAAWRSGCTLECFEAEVFGEGSVGE
jgi:uncharacterized protein